MLVYGLNDAGQYQQELDIFIRCVARIQQVHAVVRYHRPVVMLTGTIHAGKRLLVQQTFQIVTAGNFLHCLHY